MAQTLSPETQALQQLLSEPHPHRSLQDWLGSDSANWQTNESGKHRLLKSVNELYASGFDFSTMPSGSAEAVLNALDIDINKAREIASASNVSGSQILRHSLREFFTSPWTYPMGIWWSLLLSVVYREVESVQPGIGAVAASVAAIPLISMTVALNISPFPKQRELITHARVERILPAGKSSIEPRVSMALSQFCKLHLKGLEVVK